MILVALLTLFLALVVWYMIRRGSKGRSQNKSENKGNRLGTAAQEPDASEDPPNTINNEQLLETQELGRASEVITVQDDNSTDAVFANSEETTDYILMQLRQERKKRETAEDWLKFLECELEAHIRACTEAERRCKRLEEKLNAAASPVEFPENTEKTSTRIFKNIDEARLTWQKLGDRSNINELEHDETEWLEVVDANLRFLQMTQHKQHFISKGIKIVKDKYQNPVEQKNLDIREGKSKDSNENNFGKLPSLLSQTLNQNDDILLENSLSDVKKVTELWENMSNSKEKPLLSEDLLSTDNTGKNSPHSSCSDITPGVVKQNLKMWENTENQ